MNYPETAGQSNALSQSGYGQMNSAAIQPNLSGEITDAISHAIMIRDMLRNHHSSLFGASPEPLEKAASAPPSNTLASTQMLNTILVDIRERLERAGSFL